jgi:outer membrane receptor protein involved in Fe transport
MNKRASGTAGYIVIAMALAGAPARAQLASGEQSQASAPATAPTEANSGEIIVTAQKRNEKLRDVPASISVLRGDMLERIGATSLADYATYAPGLTVNSGGTPGKTTIVLRGISTGGGGPLVGTYLDDTPLGSSSGFARSASFQLDLLPYDLDRLEVLRGPQGTLYGASTMGGLLKYVLRPADPNKFDLRAGGLVESTASTGRPTWGGRTAVNVPLIAGILAIRASGFYQDNAGWIDNPVRGIHNENSSTEKGGRVALSWQPAPELTIRASALLQDIHSDGNAVVQLNGTTLEPTFNKYSHAAQLPEPYTQRLRYYSLTGNYDAGFATLTSATSWSNSRNHSIVDESSIYVPFFQLFDPSAPSNGLSNFDLDVRLHKFTQEVRLASPTSEHYEWLVGGFYTNEHVLNLQAINAFDAQHVPVASITPFALVYWPTTFKEYAAFGNLTYKFSHRFDISGGVRYSHNSQDYFQRLDGVLFGGSTIDTAKSSANVATWSASARFHPDNRSTLYVRAASGYRPGGPNVPLPNVPPSYKADRLVNYELGYKATLLNGALDIDLAAFYIDWSDIQITIVAPTGSFPGNGSKASSRGFEATGSYHLTHDLLLTTNAAYTDAHLNADVPSLSGKSGDQLPGSPHWTASAALDYVRPLDDGKKAIGGIAYRYRGSSLTSLQSDPAALRIRRQSIVDAYVGLSVGPVDARIYARNLLNDRSYTTFFDPDAGVSANFVPVQPRTFGLSFDTHF